MLFINLFIITNCKSLILLIAIRFSLLLPPSQHTPVYVLHLTDVPRDVEVVLGFLSLNSLEVEIQFQRLHFSLKLREVELYLPAVRALLSDGVYFRIPFIMFQRHILNFVLLPHTLWYRVQLWGSVLLFRDGLHSFWLSVFMLHWQMWKQFDQDTHVKLSTFSKFELVNSNFSLVVQIIIQHYHHFTFEIMANPIIN